MNFPLAVAKTYIVSFRSHNDDRPSKFIVLADSMKSAINMAWEHRRMGKTTIYERRDKFDIEFLWIQLEDVIEHGKEKNAKTKVELLQRIYQFLAKTMPKNKQQKKRSAHAKS